MFGGRGAWWCTLGTPIGIMVTVELRARVRCGVTLRLEACTHARSKRAKVSMDRMCRKERSPRPPEARVGGGCERDKSYLSYLSLEGVSVGEGFFNIFFTPSPKYFEWGRSLHEFVTEFSNNVTPHRSGVAQS